MLDVSLETIEIIETDCIELVVTLCFPVVLRSITFGGPLQKLTV